MMFHVFLLLASFQQILATQTSILNLAKYTITQNDLTISGSRKHNNFTQEILNYLNSRPIPKPFKHYWAHNCAYFEFGISSYHFTIDRIKDVKYEIGPNALNTQITVHLSLNGFWKLRDEFYVNYLFGHFCLEYWWCNSDWSGSLTIVANVSANVGYNSNNGGGHITPTIKNYQITQQNFDIHETWCLIVGSFLAAIQWVIDWSINLVMGEVWSVLTDIFKTMTSVLQSTHQLTMYEDVQLHYWYTGLIAIASTHIQAQISGTLSVQLLTGEWSNYTVNLDEANINIPSNVPLSNGAIISNNNEHLYFQNNLRVTSSILQGIIWAANKRNELTPSFNFTALDSTFIFHLLWGYPSISIPENNSVTFKMGYGLANGTCYTTANPLYNTSSIVLEFNFSDLLAYGTVALEGSVNTNNITLAFQFNSINTSLLKPFLILPLIPLPKNVIQNMMILLINNSISLINSWSATHSINVPQSFLNWISNPILNIIHQSGCCNNTHGYLDFMSMCTCDPSDSDWPLCPSTASCPPSKTISTIRMNSTKTLTEIYNPINILTLDKKPKLFINDSSTSYGVWFYIYSSQSNTLHTSCNTDNVNDDLVMIKLNNTNGICMNSPITAISQYSAPKYYSLNMTNNYIVNEIKTICNYSNCTGCVYNNNQTVNIGHCYPVGNIHIMFEIFEPDSSNVCIGGNNNIEKSNVMLTGFNNTKTCNDGIIITMKNMGPILNKCRMFNNKSNSSSTTIYTTLETVNSNNNSYTFKNGCIDDKCQNCSIDQLVYMNQCESQLIKTVPVSYEFSFGNDIEICGDQIKTKLHIRWDIIISIIVGCFGFIIILISHIYHWKHSNMNNNKPYWIKCCLYSIDCCVTISKYDYKRCCQNCLQSVCNYIKNGFMYCISVIYDSFISPKLSFRLMDKKEIYHSFVLLFSSILSFISYLMWYNESPWNVFNESSFEFIGIPADTLDITDLTSILNDWEIGCEYLFIIFCIIFFVSFLSQFICTRKPFGCSWRLYRMTLILLYIHLTFLLGFMLMPTFYSFTHSVKLNPDNNNSFTGSSSIQNDCNTIIGYSFSGVFLSFFSNIILYFVYSVPIGIYFISLLFIYQLFNNENNINYYIHRMNINIPIFYYQLSSKDKASMIARIIVILFVIESMAICIESLPVIIMYQSFGTSYIWIILWMINWILPILLLYWVWKVCQFYINNDQTDSKIIKKCQTNIILNGLITFSLFCIISIATIWCESNNTKIAVWFTAISCATGFLSGAICWMFTLHFMFKNVDVKYMKLMKNNELSLHNYSLGSINTDDTKELKLRNKYCCTISNNCCSMKLKCCNERSCCGFWYFLFERKENTDSSKYGARSIWRRFCLLLGCISYGYISIKNFKDTIQETTKEMVINFVDEMDWDVQWPDNDEGGTLFDSLFHTIDITRNLSALFSLFALCMFIISLLFDIFNRTRKGLRYSKKAGWFAIIFLFGSLFIPVLPNYLSVTPINQICPKCGPEFNRAVSLLLGDCIGLFCAGIFVYEMLPIVIGTVIPAIVRSGFVVLHKSDTYKLNKIETNTVNYVMVVGAMLSPYVTFIPLLCYQQFSGDYIVGIILLIFWVLPCFIAFKIHKSDKYYYLYLSTYYCLLIAIFIYHCIRFGLPEYILRQILKPQFIVDFILGVIAEVSLTIVLLSDFIYTIILGLRHNNN